jgi:hypothetical protein
MKTKEQNKQEVVNYLTKCSQHIFVKGWEEWRQIFLKQKEITEFVKILVKEDGFEIYSFGKIRKLTNKDIDDLVENFKSNAKNQIKMTTFVNQYVNGPRLCAVKSNRYVKEQVDKILNQREDPSKKESTISKIFKF